MAKAKKHRVAAKGKKAAPPKKVKPKKIAAKPKPGLKPTAKHVLKSKPKRRSTPKFKPVKAAKPIKPPKPKKDPLAKSPASPRDRKLVKECAEAIRQLQPQAEIIFFGSRARGRAKEDSDMDLLVLTEGALSFQDEMRLLDSVFPFELESGVIICPIVEVRNRWYSDRYQAMPLARAITKHGVRL
jgi:hypothetical protein